MSDTTGNGNLSPRAAEAVRSGLEQLNFVVDELEASKKKAASCARRSPVIKLRWRRSSTVAELESRERTAMLERDQAVADRITWETLFVSINAQMRAFKIPSAPFVKDQSEEADRALAQQAEQANRQIHAQQNYDPVQVLNNLADRKPRMDRDQQRRERDDVKHTVPDTQGSA